MVDTVKCLLESSVMPEMDFRTKNTANLSILDPITESERTSMTFFPHKVMVQKSVEGGYLVEYANNLERLMYDSDIGIIEAMEMVCDVNNINMEECKVIFDESCINRIDIGAVIKADPDFDIARK